MPLPSNKKRTEKGLFSSGQGILRVYLQDNFATFPTSSHDLRNGHVLHIYFSIGNQSQAETKRHLENHFTLPDGIAFSPLVKSRILSTVNSIKKLKKLSDLRDKKKCIDICDGHFQLMGKKLPLDPKEVPCTDDGLSYQHETDSKDVSYGSPSTSNDQSTPGHVLQPLTMSSPETPPQRPYRGTLTPRKLTLKRRLQFVSEQRVKEKQRMKDTIKDLRGNLKKMKPPKYVNQTLSRKIKSLAVKEAIISDLKKQLKRFSQERPNTMVNECDIKKLKRAHDRLKKSNKLRRASVRVSASQEEFDALKAKLAHRDERIRQLEYEKTELEDELDELREQLL